MMAPTSLVSLMLFGLACAQTPGTSKEVHPKLQTWECTHKGGCVRQNTAVVLDELIHPVHQVQNPTLGCGSWGSAPNVTVCPDVATCAKNCVVEGISNYTQYGLETKGDSITLHQVLPDGSVVSPRAYLLNEKGDQYEMIKLTGREVAFDADMSRLPCGMNAALYMSEMNSHGGTNKLSAGAKYGAGYCDAQCFTLPFIDGVGNIAGNGACCNEMDLWEANSLSTGLTPHPCNVTGPYQCSGAECSFTGVCDQWGCGFNPYAEGNHDYYGRHKKVDTNRPFTVITQFPADKNGVLQSINRLYIQDGKLIQNAVVNVTGMPAVNNITDAYCTAQGTGATSRFFTQGALEETGEALARGMVLIFSIWWDVGGFMNWLDTGNSGPCNTTEGDPTVIVKVDSDPQVTWSNIRWGEIGSTFKVGKNGW